MESEQIKRSEWRVKPVCLCKKVVFKGAYSLQSNRKMEDGEDHPGRDAQFGYINQQVCQALARSSPVISVDTKKKELLGNYDNKGRQWRKAKSPRPVNGHDFAAPELPRAYPYGIRSGTEQGGLGLYLACRDILITADGGAVMDIGFDSGNWNCRSWLMKQDFRSWSAIFLLVQASGIKVSIVCLRLFHRTGAVNLLQITKPLCA